MKRDIQKSWISYPQVWKGTFAWGQGQVWPSQQRWDKRWRPLGETTQCEWEEVSLVEETLRSGTHEGRAFTCLKGGQGNHCYWGYVLLILWSGRLLCSLLLFSRVVMMFNTRISCLGILILLREASWRILYFILHIKAQGQATSFRYNIIYTQV